MDKRLRKAMAGVLGVDPDIINDDTSIHNMVEWDSLKHIEIIMAVEGEFQIEPLTMDEIVEMTVVSKIKEILAERGVSDVT